MHCSKTSLRPVNESADSRSKAIPVRVEDVPGEIIYPRVLAQRHSEAEYRERSGTCEVEWGGPGRLIFSYGRISPKTRFEVIATMASKF